MKMTKVMIVMLLVIIMVMIIMTMMMIHLLQQRIKEYKTSTIKKQLRGEHNLKPTEVYDQLSILKKCKGNLKWLIFQMLVRKSKRPKLV